MKLNKNLSMKISIFVLHFVNLANSEVYDYDRCSCRISTHQNNFNEFQPLILHATGAPKFLYPEITNPNAIETRMCEIKIRVSCPADSLTIKSVPKHLRSAFAYCIDRTIIKLSETNHTVNSFREIGCVHEQFPVARQHESRYCPGDSCIEVGFQLNKYDFLPTIDILVVDVPTLQPLIAHLQIIPVIEGRQAGRNAWSFKKGPIFNKIPYNFHEVYKRDYQRRRFMEIFRDAHVVNKYVPQIGNPYNFAGDAYLIEGQLVTERDFFYKVQQSSAYFYENITPIWRSIATGNWELSGEFVRKLASESAEGLHVWSGTIGVLRLPDYHGYARKIFLIDGRYGQQVPVPRLLYKYVYDEQRHRGLVLVTINDPHLVNGFTNDLILCPDLRYCHTLYPNFIRVDHGYTYCCSLEGFMHVAQSLNLPTFPGAASFV